MGNLTGATVDALEGATRDIPRDAVIRAIAASWSRDTSAVPEQWSDSNPAKGHCDVSSFVAWEHLGGDLVLGQVHLDGTFQEFHYWNRVDDVDLDLTRTQFKNGEVITEDSVLDSAYLAEHQGAMRPELADRIAVFRETVNHRLTDRRSAVV